MKILLTGASGFLGRHIVAECQKQHDLITVGRCQNATVVCDITKPIPVLPSVDMVVHAAGKAHSVPKTNAEKTAFLLVNQHGTLNLLNALRDSNVSPKTLVFISSVAVYGVETGKNITEATPLQGVSVYAQSKIIAEQDVLTWGKENGVGVVVLRLPLVVGKNPPGNLGAMINALKKGYYFRIGTATAKRSMVLATDVAQLLPTLLGKQGIYNLTDGQHPAFNEIENLIAAHYKKSIRTLPMSLIMTIAKIGDAIPKSPINTYRLQKLMSTLIFSDAKAREELAWKPRAVLENFELS